jgi:hypothetical protein
VTDWLDRKQKDLKDADDAARRREYVVSVADYWLVLWTHLDECIKRINSESRWSGLLKGTPLKIVAEPHGYELQKGTVDAVYVRVINGGDSITFEFRTRDENFAIIDQRTETWKVDADDRHVWLSFGRLHLTVPEQVAEYLMQPIIEELEKNLSGL